MYMSNICIVLLTAGTTPERLTYAKATLHATLDRLHSSSGHVLSLHIGDDGSGRGYQQQLIAIADQYGYAATLSDSGRLGYGCNYNLAMRTVQKMGGIEYVLPLEDDWELTHEFDVDPVVNVLQADIFDSVRLGYIGYTQPLYCEFKYFEDKHWLLLREDSHEPHVFSGHPRLETMEYVRRVGPWPERLSPGETEWVVATQMPEARRRVGYPLWAAGDVKNGVYAHIGTVKSYA